MSRRRDPVLDEVLEPGDRPVWMIRPYLVFFAERENREGLKRFEVSIGKVDPSFFTLRVGKFFLPPNFEATAYRADVDGPTVTMKILMDDSRPLIHELEITLDGLNSRSDSEEQEHEKQPPSAPSRAINSTLLRDIPLAHIAKLATMGMAFTENEEGSLEPLVSDDLRDEDGYYLLGSDDLYDVLEIRYGISFWTKQMNALAVTVDKRPPSPNRYVRVTDDLLCSVASEYREAIANGIPPKKAVAQAHFVSTPTAGRYIMLARKSGHLGPTLPGKKGEAPTPSPSP